LPLFRRNTDLRPWRLSLRRRFCKDSEDISVNEHMDRLPRGGFAFDFRAPHSSCKTKQGLGQRLAFNFAVRSNLYLPHFSVATIIMRHTYLSAVAITAYGDSHTLTYERNFRRSGHRAFSNRRSVKIKLYSTLHCSRGADVPVNPHRLTVFEYFHHGMHAMNNVNNLFLAN
jgi:hypothetical protein